MLCTIFANVDRERRDGPLHLGVDLRDAADGLEIQPRSDQRGANG